MPEEFAMLSSSTTPPSAQSIINLTSMIDGKSKLRRLRQCASSFIPFLESLEQYFLAMEAINSPNRQIAALVWGSLKIVILVCVPLARFDRT